MLTVLIIIAALALAGALTIGLTRRRSTLTHWETTQISPEDRRALWHKHD